jgi:hypothetical protein
MIITDLEPDVICQIAKHLNAISIEVLHKGSSHFRNIIKTPEINRWLDIQHWEECTTRYINGNTSAQGHFKDSISEGFWKYWWMGGSPRSQGRFNNGKPIGPWKYWDETGNIVIQNTFNDHGRQATWVEAPQGR